MNENNVKIAVDKEYKAFLTKVASGVVAAAMAILLFFLFSGIGFYGEAITYFVVFYVVFLIGLFFSITNEIVSLIAVNVVALIVTLVLVSNSIDHRKHYIENGFLLEAYIDDYPSYLDVLKHSFGLGSDVSAFANDCLGTKDEPVPKNKMPETCLGLKKIQENYGVDLIDMIITYHGKMKRTARAIEEGTVDRLRYPACINRKSCGYVPLPPSNLSERQIESSKDPEITILRDGFWDLIDRREITPRVCANMYLCNTPVDRGMLNNADFKAMQRRQNPSFEENIEKNEIQFNQIR